MADVASTILAQLGGNKFVAMTGAKNFLQSSNSLTFKFPTAPKTKCNSLKIELAGDDTYTLTFFNIRGLNANKVKVLDGIHVENLRSAFTNVTGLLTSLKGESLEELKGITMKQALEIQEYEVTGFDEAKAPKSVKVFSTDAKTAQIIAQSKHKMSAQSAKLIDPSKKSDIHKHTVPPTKQLGVKHDAIPAVKK